MKLDSLLRRILPRRRPGRTAPELPPFDVDRRAGDRRDRKRVLVATEHVNATYVISFARPLEALRARGELDYVTISERWPGGEGNPAAIEEAYRALAPDVVVFSRFSAPWGRTLLAAARADGVPVVYHIDDDLLDLPESLGPAVLRRHGSPEVLGTRRALLDGADLIYASTARLAERLAAYFPQARVTHGIYATHEPIEAAGDTAPREGPVIGYMGSRGHAEDLALVVPALTELLETRPELRFEVFGTIALPEPLERFGERVAAHPVRPDYDAFLRVLAGLPWDLGLAPLVDTPFNRCKAPTKFIEYTASGIPVAASRMPVYEEVVTPGTSGWLAGEDEWLAVLSAALDDPDGLRRCASGAAAECAQRFPPEKLQVQVRDVLERADRRARP